MIEFTKIAIGKRIDELNYMKGKITKDVAGCERSFHFQWCPIMGNSNSNLQGSSVGLHILSLHGPAAQSGLELYFDYITHINGNRISSQIPPLKLTQKPVNLIVYSSKTTLLRNIHVIPHGNQLGINGKFCDFERAHERVWHLLQMYLYLTRQPNSPAYDSGLQSENDYILGCSTKILNDKNDFFNLVKEMKDKPLTLIVYNSEQDVVRDVVIIPAEWKGEGLLGCDIGYGLMHRIGLNFQQEAITTKAHDHSGHSHNHKGHNHVHSDSCNHEHTDHSKDGHSGHSHDHGHSKDELTGHEHNGSCKHDKDPKHDHSDHSGHDHGHLKEEHTGHELSGSCKHDKDHSKHEHSDHNHNGHGHSGHNHVHSDSCNHDHSKENQRSPKNQHFIDTNIKRVEPNEGEHTPDSQPSLSWSRNSPRMGDFSS